MSDLTTTRHVAVLAFPFGTHAAPLLTLTRRLSAAANTTVIFSFLSTPSSLSTLSFSTNPNDNITPIEVKEERLEGPFNIHLAVGRFIGSAKEGFREAVARAEREKGIRVCCLLTDAFLWFACDLAEEMDVAWVPYWTAAGCSLLVHLNTDLIRERFGGTNGPIEKLNETLSFLPGLSDVNVKCLPDGVLHGDFEAPLAIALHKMGQNLQKATAVAINSFEELEPETTKDLKSKLQKVLHVGPTLLPTNSNDVNGCLSWLDTHISSSVAYISFGTVASPPPNEVSALAEALLERKTPFLWSLRDHFLGLFPKGFIEEIKDFGKIVSWAPQVQVLAHPSVGVFVTHCGWNSTSESIIGGVPIICRPFFGDQNLNSFMVQDIWKIGIRVGDGVFSKNEATKALDLVLLNEEGEKMRKNIRIAKDKATVAIGSKGTSSMNFENLLEVIKIN